MSDTAVIAFLGDQERAFDLIPHLVELERIVGAGTGAIVKRVIAGDFHAVDIVSIVRLALIGGGATPKEAAAITAEYVTARPLAEGHDIATLIVMTAWAGKPKSIPSDPTVPGELILDTGSPNPTVVSPEPATSPFDARPRRRLPLDRDGAVS